MVLLWDGSSHFTSDLSIFLLVIICFFIKISLKRFVSKNFEILMIGNLAHKHLISKPVSSLLLRTAYSNPLIRANFKYTTINQKCLRYFSSEDNSEQSELKTHSIKNPELLAKYQDIQQPWTFNNYTIYDNKLVELMSLMFKKSRYAIPLSSALYISLGYFQVCSNWISPSLVF